MIHLSSPRVRRRSAAHLRGSHFFFFFNDTATTEIYTLSLHDALPISGGAARVKLGRLPPPVSAASVNWLTMSRPPQAPRSEEHTSELQSPCNLVCRLLLEKKKKKQPTGMRCAIDQRQSATCNHEQDPY